MHARRFCFMLAVVLITLVATLMLSEAKVIYVDVKSPYPKGDGSIDLPYRSISKAISMADDGDIIYVFPGVYNETIRIDKRLTLEGSESGDTIICKNDRHKHTIEICASMVTIENLIVKSIGDKCWNALIYVSSNLVTLQGITINASSKNVWAIYLDHANDGMVGNNVINGSKGIYVVGSVNDVFAKNRILNAEFALKFKDSDNAIAYGNRIENNSYGIYMDNCVCFNITNNTICNNVEGIKIYRGGNNLIFKNDIELNSKGVDIDSAGNRIKNNTFHSNEIAILLRGTGSTICGNVFKNSTLYGIYAEERSGENIIYMNTFEMNYKNAFDEGNNQWDDGKIGNYWDDYNNVDRNRDGIGDYPYFVGKSCDRYPTGAFLKPPDKPINVYPEDGATNVGLNPTLQVKVSDPDSEVLTVYFYSATDNKLLGEVHGVRSGEVASYTLRLPYDCLMAWYAVANDSKQETASDIWIFTTLPTPPANKKPVADPGGPYYGNVNETIQFDGTASFDPDGEITFYRWNFGDGSGEILDPRPTHVYKKEGVYQVTLTVVDNNGTSDTKITNAYISGKFNKKPVANPGGPYLAKVKESILFDASNSYDPDGEIVNYSWDFGDNSKAYGKKVKHSYSKEGTYQVTLTVTDDKGEKGTAFTYAVVKGAKKSPGFEIIALFIAISLLFLYRRKAR